jgi:hypothetical protein
MKHLEYIAPRIFAIIFTLAMLALFNALATYIETHGL